MKIYLVIGDETGRVYACLHEEDCAEHLAEWLDEDATVVERNLIFGQPSVRGYNE